MTNDLSKNLEMMQRNDGLKKLQLLQQKANKKNAGDRNAFMKNKNSKLLHIGIKH